MEHTVNATEARIHFGELMQQAIDRGEPIIVERGGKAHVVVLSIDAYRRLLKIDLVFPFLYVPSLFVTLQWAAQLLGFDVNPLLLAILPGLVGLSDLTENGILLSQTKPQTGGPSVPAIRLSSLATRLKIVGYTLCAALPPAAWILITLWRSIPS